MKEKKKGFIEKFLEKIDKKLEEKSQERPSCCCGETDDEECSQE